MAKLRIELEEARKEIENINNSSIILEKLRITEREAEWFRSESLNLFNQLEKKNIIIENLKEDYKKIEEENNFLDCKAKKFLKRFKMLDFMNKNKNQIKNLDDSNLIDFYEKNKSVDYGKIKTENNSPKKNNLNFDLKKIMIEIKDDLLRNKLNEFFEERESKWKSLYDKLKIEIIRLKKEIINKTFEIKHFEYSQNGLGKIFLKYVEDAKRENYEKEENFEKNKILNEFLNNSNLINFVHKFIVENVDQNQIMKEISNENTLIFNFNTPKEKFLKVNNKIILNSQPKKEKYHQVRSLSIDYDKKRVFDTKIRKLRIDNDKNEKSNFKKNNLTISTNITENETICVKMNGLYKDKMKLMNNLKFQKYNKIKD